MSESGELDERPPAADELAFDVGALPGGARATIEAVLMVADEPIPAVRLAGARIGRFRACRDAAIRAEDDGLQRRGADVEDEDLHPRVPT